MIDKETVIRGLESCLQGDCFHCPYWLMTPAKCERLIEDALLFLKKQETSTVEPRPEELEPETKAWLDQMDAIEALNNIANICVDWDGYRAADGLGELINKIWAYARYCAQKLSQAQEPRVMTLEEVKSSKPDPDTDDNIVWVEWRDGCVRVVHIIGIDHFMCAECPSELDTLIYEHLSARCQYEIHGQEIGNVRQMMISRLHIDSYDKAWRCWTSRPTEAQREAIPWSTAENN